MHCMAALVLQLPGRMILQGAGSHMQGAACLQVWAPLYCLCWECVLMCFSTLGRGFHKLESLISSSQLSS